MLLFKNKKIFLIMNYFFRIWYLFIQIYKMFPLLFILKCFENIKYTLLMDFFYFLDPINKFYLELVPQQFKQHDSGCRSPRVVTGVQHGKKKLHLRADNDQVKYTCHYISDNKFPSGHEHHEKYQERFCKHSVNVYSNVLH